MFICQLIKKIYIKKNKIIILTSKVKKWDDLLWSFEKISFIPHSIEDKYSPISIIKENPYKTDVLINLTNNIIPYIHGILTLIEIYNNQYLEEGRKKYKYYRSKKYRLTIHKI